MEQASDSATKPCRRRPRVPKLKHTSLRVLSIDVGLRNLGMAVVRLVGLDQSKYEQIMNNPRALLTEHVHVELAENVDVLEENGCTAKNAKSIGPLKQVSFFHASMLRRTSQILDPPPDVLVVEVQDGGNATMRQVSTGIVGLFMGHFEAMFRSGLIPHVPVFTMIRGDMKMKVCNVILGDHHHEDDTATVAAAAAAPAALTTSAAPAETMAEVSHPQSRSGATPPPPPEYLKRINPRKYFALLNAHESGKQPSAAATSGRSRQAYEMRKKTAVLAFETYIEEQLAARPDLLCESLQSSWGKATAKKKRDISDAILQGMYIVGRELKVDMGVRV
jgi:hypothetical protein